MTEQTCERLSVKATPDRCLEVITDFDAYPDWAADIKAVEVAERDELGRPVRVRFRAAAFGRSTTYTLAYDYSRAPQELSWRQVEGDITSKLDGAYEFDPTADGETDVSYRLSAELKVPIPGFVKRRAEARIVTAALKELAERVTVLDG
ncbi:MAG: SRPBCC family protein [Acidimicrobiales bacterium]